MTNLKWHADQLNKISDNMKRPRGANEIGAADDGTQTEVVKRSRPNQLLRKLRNAQRHRQAQIARPQSAAGNVTTPDPLAAAQWSKRGVMPVLVPLSIVGMVSLFVLGFVGSREVVGFLVGPEYMPASLAASEQDAQEQVPTADGLDPNIAPSLAASNTDPEEAAPETLTAEPAQETEEPFEDAIELAEDPLQPVEGDGDTFAEAPSLDDVIPPTQDAEAPAVLIEDAPADPEPDASDSTDLARAHVDGTPPGTSAATDIDAAPEPDPAALETPAATPRPKVDFRMVATPQPAEEEPQTGHGNDDPPVEPRRRDEQDATDPSAPAVATEAGAENEPVDASVAGLVDTKRLLAEGHTLMAAGDVLKARQLFARSVATGSAEAALALGRSFDPKHLAGIGNANATPDPVTARRWYEEWYRRSVQQGSISPKVRLERLLQAMNAN